MIRTIRGGRDDARRSTPSGDIRTLRRARRADTTAATGTPITRQHDVDPVQREIAFSEGRSGERHVIEQRSEGEEECEADGNAREPPRPPPPRRPQKSDAAWRRRAASRRSAPHAAPPTAGSRSRSGSVPEQEGDGSAGQNELQNRSAPDGVLTGVAVGRCALDGSDLDRRQVPFESWRAVWPMTMISEFGDGNAAAPMVPICVPDTGRAARSPVRT